VYPTELFVIAPNHSTSISVSNPTDTLVEVWVSFTYGYPVAYDTGKVSMYNVDTAAAGEPSAVGWIRAYPQRFSLGARESRIVRLFGVPPPGLLPGEYWARVVVSSKLKNPRVAKPKSNQSSFVMNIVTETGLPFHFRTGSVQSNVSVTQARASIEHGALQLHLDLRRTGNASFWGRIKYELLGANDKVLRAKDYRIVVYKEMSYTVLDSLPLNSAGPFTVRLLIDNAHPSLAPQNRLKSEPLMERIPVGGTW
jgi:hypothetical protein